MASPRNRKVFTGLTMASSLAWMSILPATAVFASSTPTVTPGSVTLSGPIQPTNGSATFTASASDPNGTAEYQFWVESPAGQWTDMQNYSTNNMFTLATPSAGDYLVAVEVLDQAQVAAGDWSLAQTTLPDAVFTGSTLSVLSNASGEVAKGQNVTLTATATNVFSPLYQFWYQEPDGTWVQSGNYQSSNTFTFTASQAGTYKYVAYVKSPLAANNPHGALESNVGSQVAYGTASQVVLSLASPSVMANGSATDLLTATVEDRNGNTVANFSGSVTIVETNPQFSGNLVNGAGSARVTITNGVGPVALTPVSGDGNYRYTVTSDNLMSAATAAGGTAGQGQVANVTYGSATVMTTAPSDHGLGLQSTLPNLESNAQSSTTVWVQLQDSTGAPYTTTHGQYVTLTLGGSASGSFSSATIDTTDTIEVPVGASQFPVTVYSEPGSNGILTVMAQSNDPSVTPLTPASLSIPVVEVGNPTAVDIRQVGSSGSAAIYQADIVDSHGNTISLGSAAAGDLTLLGAPPSGDSAFVLYAPAAATNSGFVMTATGDGYFGYNTPYASVQTGEDLPFVGGVADIAISNYSFSAGNGQPLPLTVTDVTATPNVSGSLTWHFAAPTAGHVESLPVYAGSELARATVTAGETTSVAFQLTDQYGNAVQEAGQPIWFTLQDSGVAALPNGASQSGDTYEAFTNSQGIASVPLTVLNTAAPSDMVVVTGSGTLPSDPENGPRTFVVSSANYATGLTLSDSSAASLNGMTITIPAGTPLPTLTATLTNALGGVASGNTYDQLLWSSSNSGVVSVGSGSSASGGTLEYYRATGRTGGAAGGTYLFGQGVEFSGDGLYAGMAGTATITVTDESNAAKPSASFTVKVIPGAPVVNAPLYYQGAPLSASNNPGNLPSGSVVEMWVKNVDAGGDPLPVTGTTSLEVILPTVANGEWATVSGGSASSVAVVSLPTGSSSAPVWFESTGSVTSSAIGGARAMDAAQELSISPATVSAASAGTGTYTATAANVFGEALNASDVIWASFLPGTSSASAEANSSALGSTPTMEALSSFGTLTIRVTAPTAGSLPSNLSGTVVVQDLPSHPDQVKTAQFND